MCPASVFVKDYNMGVEYLLYMWFPPLKHKTYDYFKPSCAASDIHKKVHYIIYSSLYPELDMAYIWLQESSIGL